MQDRFKFRFWHKPTNKMVDCYGFNKDFVFGDTLDGVGTDYNPAKFEDCILMQCTGLKDKNDRLIYEGDIIYKKGTKNYKGQKMYSEVIWDQMYAEFNISDDNGMHRMPSNSNNIEIIGNIFENPELLEEKQCN